MASRATLILFGYMSAFGCLQLLPEAAKQTPTPQAAAFPRLAVLPAAVATFGLTSLLLCAHVRALGRPDAAAAAGAGAGRRRFVDRLASATVASAATVALLLLTRLLAADGVDYWLNAE